jgi:hypothetical protein
MRAFGVLVVLSCVVGAAVASNTVTGLVRNESRGQPAAGDEVFLVRIDQGMQEEARATTDGQGMFSLAVLFPDKPHLVRVIHQGVNYDEPVSSPAALSIQVFDVATRVTGVTGSLEILRLGTNGRLLHVSDMYEIRNESSPPITLTGDRTLDVYLPPNAKLDSVLAAGPGKIGETISAVATPGEPGHYFVNFPLRPEATKFAFNYDLPYSSDAVFRTRHEYPVQMMAVMIPSSMRFSSQSPGFSILATGSKSYEVHTVSRLAAGKGRHLKFQGRGCSRRFNKQPKQRCRHRC